MRTKLEAQAERKEQANKMLEAEGSPWRYVFGETERMPVPGGWLYRVYGNDGVALAFVPDPSAGFQE